MQNLPRIISRISKKTPVHSYPLGYHSYPPSSFPLSRSINRLQFCLNNNLSTLGSRGLDSVPGYFLKWAALGFSRGSSFATGFTPLQRKPLDSIIDIERAKLQSPEDLISAWEDPAFCHSIVEGKWLYEYVHSRLSQLLLKKLPRSHLIVL